MPVDHLPDDAIVVRGGIMRDLTHLGQQAEDSLLADGVYALSVFCGTLEQGETLDERLAEVVEEAPIPNSQIRVSTAGAAFPGRAPPLLFAIASSPLRAPLFRRSARRIPASASLGETPSSLSASTTIAILTTG